ncbi:MAG: hypothetical protein JJU34_11710 [Lunatimonas sp.]|uniref:hypothetical protein n=1 Tax=Lunatimonas sp. TaxID=2060141 RepID=UPI00263AF79F|nr:hypothetical protein [Lunatimonas sp.]MCC5937936.1 hypothetical protein [Lunatimonas sp.]
MNRAQIAAAFCENKDLPELACNGSCELGRRLSDAKEKESEKEKMFLEEILLHYILTEPQMLEPVCYSIGSLVYASPRVSLATFEIGLDFFHPPRRA